MSVVGYSALRALISHHVSVGADDSLERVHSEFRRKERHYAAVIRDGRVIGACASSDIADVLSGRYGFALASRARAAQHMTQSCLICRDDDPLLDVLDRVLTQSGVEFGADVVVVDEAGVLVGLIEVRSLVHAQSRMVREQITLLDAQREELTAMNSSLERMLEQRQALEADLVRNEKAALVETVAGGVAHEINNKLSPIIGYAELMLEAATSVRHNEFTVYCETVLHSALDSARIINQLLQLSKPAPVELSALSLVDVIRDSLALVQLRVKEAGIGLTIRLPLSAVPVHLDAAQFKQVVVNLLLNAVDALESSDRKTIVVELDVVDAEAIMTVSDSGPGIPPAILHRIFDPFFTTKGPSRGTGLGLAVCSAVVRQHHGTIEAGRSEWGGASFRVTLPIASESAIHVVPRSAAPGGGHIPVCVSGSAAPRTAVREPAARTVLVVDDEAAVSDFVVAALRRRAGYGVDVAHNGAQAIERLTTGRYAMILSDVRMPVMNGVELFDWVCRHRPDLAGRMVFTTGDAGESDLNARLAERGCRVLRKPFSLQALLACCREVAACPEEGAGDEPATASDLTISQSAAVMPMV